MHAWWQYVGCAVKTLAACRFTISLTLKKSQTFLSKYHNRHKIWNGSCHWYISIWYIGVGYGHKPASATSLDVDMHLTLTAGTRAVLPLKYIHPTFSPNHLKSTKCHYAVLTMHNCMHLLQPLTCRCYVIVSVLEKSYNLMSRYS